MNLKEQLTLDQADQIRELAASGYGRNKISAMVGVNSSAVKAVIQGSRVHFSERLSTRQIQALLNQAFQPWQ